MKLLPGKVPQVFFMLLFACASFTSFAQTRVSGKVVDSKTNAPVANVSVRVKSSGKTVQTGTDGSYTVDAPSANAVLTFSSVGYTAQDATAKNGSLNISFVQSSTQLQDVVVVAYGTRKKSDLTGAVVSVGQKDFQKGQVTSSEQLLQGKVAGLQVTNYGGEAGGGSSIKIRGTASINLSNDPLIVIDGVPVDNNGVAGSSNLLNTINPNDIESISVLKDASSTALYGSRASAGVIIITTKKGGPGKTRFEFSTRLSDASVHNFSNVLTAQQVRNVVNANYNPISTNYRSQLGTANTDWERVILQDAPAADNNLSASGTAKFGGNIRIPFRLSGGYLTQTGVLNTNKFERSTAALNLSPKMFKNNLSVNLSAKYAHTHTRFADEGAIGSALAFDPTQQVLAPYGKYGGYYEYLQADGTPNPLAPRNPLALLQQRHNIGNVDRLTTSLQLDYKLPFFPDLHVQVNGGLDNSGGTGYNTVDSTSATASAPKKGQYNDYREKKENYILEAFLFYNKDLPKIKSKVDVLAGHTYQDISTTDYAFPTYYSGVLDTTTKVVNPSTKNEYRMESYLARLNYSYNNKYLLTGSARRDATSKFAPDQRVGYFYGGAVAWKLKEEFLKNVSLINELKLRVGYGETGNQDGIGYYAYFHDYFQSSTTAQYQFGNNYYYFYRPAAYNNKLTWETTDNTNLGLDFALLKNRISGSVDVYERKSKKLLSTIPVAPGSNFNISLLYNVGNLSNRGVEASLNLTPVKTKNFSWDVNVNGSYNKSKITNLLLIQDPSFKGISVGGISGGTGNTIQKDLVNYSPNYFYVMKQVYDAAGKPIEGLYEDLNRDGVVNSDDSYMAKPSQPDFVFGFSTQFNIRRFFIGAAGHGMAGNYNYNNVNSNTGTLNSLQNPLSYISNASTDYLYTGFKTKQYFSDYYIQNASFLKIDNINIGYDYGKLSRNSKATLRLNASVQNVATITKYKGTDPEVAGGIDNNIYPRPTTYSIGANIGF